MKWCLNLSGFFVYKLLAAITCLGMMALPAIGQQTPLPPVQPPRSFESIQLPPITPPSGDAQITPPQVPSPSTQPASPATTQSINLGKVLSGEVSLTPEQLLGLSSTQPAPATHPSPAAREGDDLKVTRHQIKLTGRTLDYTATTGRIAIKDDAGKVQADLFFVAYQLDQPADAKPRPITFVFNGGPGAAAVWLHVGCAGPRRVKLTNSGDGPPPPYELVDNEQTWLDATDLVFIDPAGTGYSRVAEGVDSKKFYGLSEDIQSVGDFIQLLLTRLGRWNSPIFLAGESYGTTRAAGLSDYLLEHHGIALNGVILISSVLNFQTILLRSGNDLPYALYLPSYTAIAWHHKKLPANLQQLDLPRAIAQSKSFATEIYLPALLKGSPLSKEETETVIHGLAQFTGLPEDMFARMNLRVNPDQFAARLLADQQQVIGRFDARLTGYQIGGSQESSAFDPSLSRILPVYTATFNQYAAHELGYRSDLKYEVLSSRVWPWNFDDAGQGYADTGVALNAAMVRNPSMKILVASGYFDLATPFFATDYTLSRMDLPAELRKNIQERYFPAGHMVYHDPASRQSLHDSIAQFIQASRNQP